MDDGTLSRYTFLFMLLMIPFLVIDQALKGNTMFLLTNCEVHMGNIGTAAVKYGPNKVRSIRKTKVQIFSHMDQTNWSIRTLLYSHNQRPKSSENSEMNIFQQN